jgi:hypothetical protein
MVGTGIAMYRQALLCIERRAMSANTDFILSFDPDAWEFSVVTHTPRSWLPPSIRSRQALDPRARQMGAARASWHRAGRGQRREGRR